MTFHCVSGPTIGLVRVCKFMCMDMDGYRFTQFVWLIVGVLTLKAFVVWHVTICNAIGAHCT